MSSVARFLEQHAEELQGKSPQDVQAFPLANIFAPSTPVSVKAALGMLAQQQAEAGLVLTAEQDAAANRALVGFDFRPVLTSVTAETLVVSGRHDPLNPVEEGQEIARLIPHARFEVLERSGHVPETEEPERLLELVETFLKA